MSENEEPPPDIKSTLDAMNRTDSVGSGSILRGALFAATVLLVLAIALPLLGGYAIGAAMSAGTGGAGSALFIIPVAAVSIITL